MVAITSSRPYGRPVVVERKPTSLALEVPSSPVPSTSSVSSSPRNVRFADTPDKASRPLQSVEHWSAYRWEQHAISCPDCRYPGEVFRNGGQLCVEGHALARDIACLARYRDGDIYSTQRDDAGSLVRLEFPPDYRRLRSLLRAQEHSTKAKRPIITYGPAPRLPTHRADTHATTIVTPHHTSPKSRSYPPPSSPNTSPRLARRDSVHEAPRHSLFCDDSDGERPRGPRRAQTATDNAHSHPDDRHHHQPVRSPDFRCEARPDVERRGSLYRADQERRSGVYRVEIREPSAALLAEVETRARKERRRTSVWY